MEFKTLDSFDSQLHTLYKTFGSLHGDQVFEQGPGLLETITSVESARLDQYPDAALIRTAGFIQLASHLQEEEGWTEGIAMEEPEYFCEVCGIQVPEDDICSETEEYRCETCCPCRYCRAIAKTKGGEG